ncbi:MAG TPA: sigma-54-dependent Fis family transcriptional regulator [Vicinamibacterales bacterium]|nr:sigma-54-dependent Fis family transcriptional regulator [Vicinamibacterales bacterium]
MAIELSRATVRGDVRDPRWGRSSASRPSPLLARLDRLAAEGSTRLMERNTSDLGAAIGLELRNLAETVDVDGATVGHVADTRNPVGHVYSWLRPGVRPRSPGEDGHRDWAVALLGESRRFEVESSEPEADGVSDTPGNIRATLVVPVRVNGGFDSALALGTIERHLAWENDLRERIRLIAEILASALHRLCLEEEIARRRRTLSDLRERARENSYLREEILECRGFDEIVGDSPALYESLSRVREVAATDTSVLLEGETGTGKELFARALHAHSLRGGGPFVAVNCASLPVTLIDSELFGHERGAFTGASAARRGRFELAHQGTLFLDEIGDLPPEIQGKLLRVLQEGEFERVGSSVTRRTNVRVIAATHHDLSALVAQGRFRADLFYRLSVFPIHLAPLRDRREDIPGLVWFFIHKRQRALHRQIAKVPREIMTGLMKYSWPGNVRELQNVVERALIHSRGDTLVLDPLTSRRAREAASAAPRDTTLAEVERQHMAHVLEACGWKINGAGNAAARLDLHPNTLRFRMRKAGLTRPRRLGPGV